MAPTVRTRIFGLCWGVTSIWLNYAGGKTHTLFVVYGVHTRDWWKFSGEPISAVTDPNTSIAWTDRADGSTPLHDCASKGTEEIAAALLKAGADVTLRNKAGFTPIE